MPDFKDIRYERPDLGTISRSIMDLRLRLMTAKDVDQASDILMEYEKLIIAFNTQYELCNVLHDLDTSDEFYINELEYFDTASAELSELSSAMLTVMVNCPCAEALKQKYGEMIFRKAENLKQTVSPEVIDDYAVESSLQNDYMQIKSEAKIPFEGKECNLSELAVYLESTGRNTRKAAHKALDDYYMGQKDNFDKIFDDMVRVRTTIAKKLGYGSYTELGYKIMERYDYTPKDVAVFRDAILKYIVPLTVQIRKLQQERLGVDELMFYDLPTMFMNGNPTPIIPGISLGDVAGEFFAKIFGNRPSFLEVLSEHGFTDLISRKNKSTGGYCMFLDGYKIPFIFMNANGTSDDVSTIVHEGGHAYAAVQSADVSIFSECLAPTLETCEIHSTAMEFMSYPFMEMFYGEKAEQYRELHMTQALLFLPYGCMVDEFQHIIYDNPDLSPEERHDIWSVLEKRYQPYINYDESHVFHKAGGAWMKKDHIFTSPFYYIDYCLAHICALQLWNLSREDMKTALIKYNKLCSLGGTDTFLNLLKKSELESPFDVGVIKQVAYSCADYLNL